MPTAHRQKRGFWRRLRLYFRRFRLVIWSLLLLLLCGVVYVNQVGLPNFAKRPLLQALRDQGVDLQFSRLRWRWHQGIVAENVRFGSIEELSAPNLSAAEVQLRLNLHALARFRFQVDSLFLRQGTFVWPLVRTNEGPHELAIANINTELRFLPDDQWALDQFGADFGGGHLVLSGLLTNASSVRDWKFLQPQTPAGKSAQIWQDSIHRLVDSIDRCRFAKAPELRLDVRGDARDPQSFRALLLMAAPAAQTPWGTLDKGALTVRLTPASSNDLLRAELKLAAAGAQTRWGVITNLQLGLRVTGSPLQTNIIGGELKLDAQQVQTPWGGGTNALFTAAWLHSITNPVPLSGKGSFHCDFATNEWGHAQDISLSATLVSSNLSGLDTASWAWWTNIAPYNLNWKCQLNHLAVTNLAVDSLLCEGAWSAPRLAVSNLQLHLYQGQLQASSDLAVDTRHFAASLSTDLDPHKISALLPEPARVWLDELTWPQPPRVTGSVALVLPAWTNRQPNWSAEVQPTLQLTGKIGLDGGVTYRGLTISTARSHLSYSNLSWHLPDLVVTRPEGRVLAEYRADERSKNFYAHIRSTIDPLCLQPLLNPDRQGAFDLVAFTQPPVIDAELWGNSSQTNRLGARAHVSITNLTFRGESIGAVQTSLTFTNQFLRVLQPRVQCANRAATADGLAVDFRTQLVYLTNATTTLDPMLIARVIGPHIARAIEAYQFLNPPNARVYGVIPMHGEAGANLHFDLDGGPFHWWKLNVPHINGHVHWAGETLQLENLRCDFYDGRAAGAANFNFVPKKGADFEFAVVATNALLHDLATDLSGKTNRLQGRVSGTVIVNKANTEDWRSVNGYGDFSLRDGLLWDIPLFGIFSPVLNSFSPGLGNSRASAGACTFTITNGVLRSSDLDLRSTAMRLQYRGTVDLQNQVNARVEAELLKDMWMVGPLVSTLFWPVTKLFEFKVTGELSDPKMEPVGPIPKLVLIPFHPLRSLKGLFPEEPGRTNSVPSTP